jgi:hypothetical protein
MTDFTVQLLSAVLLLLGLWLMGDKKLIGPFLACLAELFTTVVGATHHVWSIILIGGVLFVVQGRNFLKWKREGTRWF